MDRRLVAAASGAAPVARPSRAAERGFDWYNLFVANIQTGFGPFIAVYLTTQDWTQTAIGVALSVGTVTSMASQIPAGALVDATPYKTRVAHLSVAAFAISALLLAIQPIPLAVYAAEVLHGFSSCTLGPAIAAISLGLAGRLALGARLGRNARFASIGNGIGAALMGACGYYVSERAVFLLTALLTVPAFIALWPVSATEMAPQVGRAPAATGPRQASFWRSLPSVFADRRLLVFSACALIFTFANTPLLPLASVDLTRRVSGSAPLYVAAAIVVPQLIVALISPWVGAFAERRGRRAMLLLGFTALPLRAFLLAFVREPHAMVLVQALDGVAAASFGIAVPLVTSDVAGRSGHYNLALGVIGFAMGIGGTVSTTVAGWGADRFGHPAVFLALAAIALIAPALVIWALPETRPEARPEARPDGSDRPGAAAALPLDAVVADRAPSAAPIDHP